MAKRSTGLGGKRPKSPKKTKKRLAVKQEMLVKKAAKRSRRK